MASKRDKAPIRPFVDTMRPQGRPAVPSSVGDEARAVGAYLDAGREQYALRLSELWPPAPNVRRQLERASHDLEDGHGWIRLQLSRLRKGGYLDGRRVERGISHSVQRDLFRLIAYHPKAIAWKHARQNRDPWCYPGRLQFPALQNSALDPKICALIDPESIPLFAAALADALFYDNVITERREEAQRSIEAAIGRKAPEMAWNAAAIFSLDHAANIEVSTQGASTEAIGHNVLGAIALALWEK